MYAFKKILVPLDGSPEAKEALPMAVSLAEALGSTVILLHVMDLPISVLAGEAMHRQTEALRTEIHDHATRYLADVRNELHDRKVEVRVLLREAHPAREILHVAAEEKVDVIVMCARGKGAMFHHTLGGIADKVVRQSPCPVMLVRGTCDRADAA